MDVAAPADRLNLEKNGVNVATTEPEHRGGVSAAAAVPSLRTRLSLIAAAGLHVLYYLYLARLFPAPDGLPLARVPRQEATVQVPALTVTCSRPPERIRYIATIDQNLMHTNRSPSSPSVVR